MSYPQRSVFRIWLHFFYDRRRRRRRRRGRNKKRGHVLANHTCVRSKQTNKKKWFRRKKQIQTKTKGGADKEKKKLARATRSELPCALHSRFNATSKFLAIRFSFFPVDPLCYSPPSRFPLNSCESAFSPFLLIICKDYWPWIIFLICEVWNTRGWGGKRSGNWQRSIRILANYNDSLLLLLVNAHTPARTCQCICYGGNACARARVGFLLPHIQDSLLLPRNLKQYLRQMSSIGDSSPVSSLPSSLSSFQLKMRLLGGANSRFSITQLSQDPPRLIVGFSQWSFPNLCSISPCPLRVTPPYILVWILSDIWAIPLSLPSSLLFTDVIGKEVAMCPLIQGPWEWIGPVQSTPDKEQRLHVIQLRPFDPRDSFIVWIRLTLN